MFFGAELSGANIFGSGYRFRDSVKLSSSFIGLSNPMVGKSKVVVISFLFSFYL